jgi:AcrR family transcriptional regulator
MSTATEEKDVRPLRADAARNRQKILTAAAEVFAARGLDATLDDIARHAGVGIGTVYRRFAGKEELIEALFEQAVNEVVELAVQAAEAPDSWQGLVWFLEHATEMQAEDLGLRDVILHSGYGRKRVALARERIVPAVTHLVERAQLDGHLRTDFVASDIPIIEMMVSAVAVRTNEFAPGLWRRYLVIVLDGLRASRATASELVAGPTHEVLEVAMSCHRQGPS